MLKTLIKSSGQQPKGDWLESNLNVVSTLPSNKKPFCIPLTEGASHKGKCSIEK